MVVVEEYLCAKVTIGSVVWSDGAVGVVKSSLLHPLVCLEVWKEDMAFFWLNY